MTLHIEYIKNETGQETAVQVPIQEWDALLKDYTKLKQKHRITKDLNAAFRSLRSMENGEEPALSLEQCLYED